MKFSIIVLLLLGALAVAAPSPEPEATTEPTVIQVAARD